MNANPNQDLNAPVAKFCLTLEKDRRTAEGRIRNERDFREHFFPYDESRARDRVLRFLPKDVRGPIIASWGIRGRKAALRDDDARVLAVVHDAFVAGDIDEQLFEEGLTPETVVRWCELADWWRFWRGGKHNKYSIQKALELGYDLGLFDARWFFDVIEGAGGKLRGTDVLAEGLSKTELADWIKRIHESGDGSPKGMLTALGWPTIVAKSANNVLLAVIDAFAQKNGLVKDRFLADADQDGPAPSKPPTSVAPAAGAAPVQAASSQSEGGGAGTAPDDTTAAQEEEALLGALGEAPQESEEGDWLENPSQTQDPLGDDLDVEDEDGTIAGDRPLEATGAIAELLHSDEEDSLGGGEEGDQYDSTARQDVAGLSNRGRTTPPPLPDSGAPGKRR